MRVQMAEITMLKVLKVRKDIELEKNWSLLY
jgi:hypothetical protein